MNTIQEYKCVACDKIYDYYNINKHLENCEKYNSWLENYITPKVLFCEFCKLSFIDKFFENHKINCKKYIIEKPKDVEKPKKKVIIDEEPEPEPDPEREKTIEELIIDAVHSIGNYNDIISKYGTKFGDIRKGILNILVENNIDTDKIAIDYKEIIKNEIQKMKEEINGDDIKKEESIIR